MLQGPLPLLTEHLRHGADKREKGIAVDLMQEDIKGLLQTNDKWNLFWKNVKRCILEEQIRQANAW